MRQRPRLTFCRVYDLTSEQVAAARAYVLNNPETVLAEHSRIEAKLEAGNPPHVIEQAKQTRAAFLSFKKWLIEREPASAQGRGAESASEGDQACPRHIPTFREWLSGQESRPLEGS
jgi:hypothetical protein